MHNYPSPETWKHATERQQKRALRTFARLQKRAMPVYWGPLFVDDDREVKLQSPADAARRALVLWAVELRAEGIPDEEVHGLIEQQNLWNSVSPQEKAFLENKNLNQDECQEFVWRSESIWVLMWALGYIKKLD